MRVGSARLQSIHAPHAQWRQQQPGEQPEKVERQTQNPGINAIHKDTVKQIATNGISANRIAPTMACALMLLENEIRPDESHLKRQEAMAVILLQKLPKGKR